MLANNRNSLKRILLIILMLIISGCAREEENVINAAENTEAYTSNIITEFNSIKEEESNLQGQFVEALERDEELESFANQSAAVFQNIEKRQASLESIRSQTRELENTYNNIQELNFDALDRESVTAMHTDMRAAIDQLETYIDEYDALLQAQAEYFNSLAGPEADYESFTTGIQEMTELDQQLIEIEQALNDALIELEQSTQAALETAQEQFDRRN